MWYWRFPKFLAFNCTDLHVVESGDPVRCNFRSLLFAYGLWRALFVSLEDVFEFSAILSVISEANQFNRRRRDCNKQEDGKNYKDSGEDFGIHLEESFRTMQAAK